MNRLIKFNYGALNDSLEKQANNQGYTLGNKAEQLENYNDQIHVLWINNLLTDREKDKAIERLHKKVIEAIKSLGGKIMEEKLPIEISGFEKWRVSQGFTDCDDIDILKDIYEAMDDNDK